MSDFHFHQQAYSVNLGFLDGESFDFEKPVVFKTTDPVRGVIPTARCSSFCCGSTASEYCYFQEKRKPKTGYRVRVTAHRNLLNYKAHVTGRAHCDSTRSNRY
ncbi:MAG: hypothetical protein IPP79_24310 [Chitinophagaceae bacterium]|nr:hypothetical protein [Chitinophagaceae bacterium]